MTHAERKAALEALLLRYQPLWRPQPFKIETPDWCAEFPALTAELLELDDAAVERLQLDNAALIGLAARHVPSLAVLIDLIALPPSSASGNDAGGEDAKRLFSDIPGRKQAQIVAYADALGAPRAPLLEWCAGKGHLGRLLAHRWHWPVASLEIDPTLCAAGEDLARHAQVDCMQHFIHADALADDSARHIAGRHAVALHACGDLHTRLIADAAAQGAPALDLVPCCYYRTRDKFYRPFNSTPLRLSQDDLRLAVTETVTASALERQRSRQALAWKLGWVALRKAMTGEADYRPFPPVPESWLRGDFAGFVARMRERAGIELSPALTSPSAHCPRGDVCSAPAKAVGSDLGHFEALGHARAHRMRRLELLRLAFRRPIEVWLVLDMARFLEDHGYAVALGSFCAAGLTPRNLLLSARRANR